MSLRTLARVSADAKLGLPIQSNCLALGGYPTLHLAADDTQAPAIQAKICSLQGDCVTELVLFSVVVALLGLMWWLAEGSDDDSGGGGLMQPVLVPVPVRRYPQGR